MQLQEHILSQVFCFVPVRQHAQRQAVHQALVLANQRGERRRFAANGSGQQILRCACVRHGHAIDALAAQTCSG